MRIPFGLAVVLVAGVSGQSQAAFLATLSTTVGPGLTPGNGSSEYVVRIDWTQANPVDVAWVGHNFSTFCIERNQNVYFGGTFVYTTQNLENAPIPGSGMGSSEADRIRRLWSADRAGLGTDNLKNAAFQEAIWKILDPNFQADSAVSSLVTQYLSDADNLAISKANLVALTSADHQDQITELNHGWVVDDGGEVVPNPAPASVVLASTGIIPALVFRRRFSRAN